MKPKKLILELLRKVLLEIARRKSKGQMNWTLHLDRVKNPDLFRKALRGAPDALLILTSSISTT